MKKNDIVEITITGMTTEGNGVGRYDDFAIFVPMTAFGDVVNARITKLQKTYGYGIIEKIIKPSQDRIESNCNTYQKCGGCSFRHISYKSELKIKDNFVRDAFKRIGKMDIPFEDILGCEDPDFYRNKVQYPVANLEGNAVCGFYSKRSHRVVPFSACKLQSKEFESIVNFIMEKVNQAKIEPYNEETGNGLLRHIYLRKGFHSEEIMVCFVVTSWCKKELAPIANELQKTFPNIKSIVMNKNSKSTNVVLGYDCKTILGNDTITDVMCGNKISLSPLSFYQVNTKQAERLYSIAKEYAELSGDETVMDLYCGAGTIGLSFADKAKTVLGVEIIPQAVENAKKNAEINEITNAEFICGDASEVATQLADRGENPDLIIVDPPRKGCDQQTLDAIVKMSPKRVVMVSCNPATAARDCAILCENGYVPVKARAIDMFPRTTHVECVVLMSRVESRNLESVVNKGFCVFC